ncbi:MAG: hypothetical protein ACK4TB_14265 [Gemmobacter sp.]
MTGDPLPTLWRLQHRVLRNRVISTAHEPAWGEGGLPGDRTRLCHVEMPRGAVARTMTAESVIVSRDSPAAFGNLEAWRDGIVHGMARLAPDVQAEGAAGRRSALQRRGGGVAEVTVVLALAPDAVAFATGGVPQMPDVAGADFAQTSPGRAVGCSAADGECPPP